MAQERKWSELSPREQWSKNYVLAARGMREAGRWVLGLVAGLLLAVTNLSGFGRLNPDEWRFWLAVIATIVTAISIGTIVHLFLRVQVGSGEIDLENFRPDQFALLHEYGILKNYKSMDEFTLEQKTTLDEYAKVRSSIGATQLALHHTYTYDLLVKQQDLQDKLEAMEDDK